MEQTPVEPTEPSAFVDGAPICGMAAEASATPEGSVVEITEEEFPEWFALIREAMADREAGRMEPGL